MYKNIEKLLQSLLLVLGVKLKNVLILMLSHIPEDQEFLFLRILCIQTHTFISMDVYVKA